ncbi:3D (Asp-Asp-Asp) domain-containing protein [Terribacillus aidingensis]|uniref:3D (Asp-Asp-Asp) domain-containing protein n=2 Tax=Terribacillus aidingensis TaxID=586416 RepID=A0A285NKH6_9BACI|nr:3D (Asp-Asp-Asp) domain-containing protein [Terribacillus aidingensis]
MGVVGVSLMLPDQELAEHPPPSYLASSMGAEVLEKGSPHKLEQPVPISKMMDEVKRLENEQRLERARKAVEKKRKGEEKRKKEEEEKRKAEQAKLAEVQRRLEEKKKMREGAMNRKSSEKVAQENSSVTMEATAYTNGVESTGKQPGDKAYGITASGKHTQEGLTVACPRSFGIGTWVNIEGIGDRRCDDTGKDIVEGRIDVYMRNLSEAQEFGRKAVKVTILNKEG